MKNTGVIIPLVMTRGNQRELAREKNLKKQQSMTKGREIPEGVSLQAIKTNDAEIMRQKQAKALEKKRLEEEAKLKAKQQEGKK